MNKKGIWIVTVIVLIIIIVALAGRSGTSSTPKIGVIAPLTGWGAYWGDGYVKGINLALADIHANGGKLDVVIEDGATDGLKSATAAHKLIDVDKVNALSVEFTAPTSSVSPIAAAAKIPFQYDALPKKFLDDSPYALKMYFDIGKQCYIAASYLAHHGSKHIGGLSINLDYMPECKSSLDKVMQETGIKTTMYSVDSATVDFRTTIAKMKADGIDSVVPVFYEDNAVAFFKQKNDLKFNVPIFMGIGNPDGFTEKVRSSVATSSLEGIIAYDQPISDAFKTKMDKSQIGLTEKDYIQAAYGYDELTYLYGGFTKCAMTDAACIVSAIENDHHVGALSSAGYDSKRIFQMNPVYYRYTAGQLVPFDITK